MALQEREVLQQVSWKEIIRFSSVMLLSVTEHVNSNTRVAFNQVLYGLLRFILYCTQAVKYIIREVV